MNALWSYFWPCFAAGLLVGGPAGSVAFRRRSKRTIMLAIGVVVTTLLAALWHGPLGGADRFTKRVEGEIHQVLVYYEMTQVTGHLHHEPLTRRVLLAGTADDFQSSELVRYMNQVPGVSSATWSADGGGTPLIAEGVAVALVGFLFGLLLAYLVELRRRYNAQWNW
jgi:membrane protease YdiL (CAAX protease family)